MAYPNVFELIYRTDRNILEIVIFIKKLLRRSKFEELWKILYQFCAYAYEEYEKIIINIDIGENDREYVVDFLLEFSKCFIRDNSKLICIFKLITINKKF